MHVIIWKYQVKTDRTIEFEQIYHSNGVWVELFRKGSGYINTELLRDKMQPQRYITIDRWHSAEDYEMFVAKFKKEYETLDAHCKGLTEQESLLGKWESANYETR
jgi:heme-degrading monooxygenase HmoA